MIPFIAMNIARWNPAPETSPQEEVLLRRLKRTRKLFGFLREHRAALFDESFQDELSTMYRSTGAGRPPVPPALMAMATILQGYLGVSDAEAVELAVVDLRWQMVLGRLGSDEPPFSQGALQKFRERLIEHDMDRRLLERTRELALATKGFDAKKLPKSLRAAMDSAPLEGAGRVEDSINLIAHAARKVILTAAALLDWTPSELCKKAQLSLFMASSVKKGLDRDWTDPEQKASAVNELMEEVFALDVWLGEHLLAETQEPPLKDELRTLYEVIGQDLEPDPEGGGDSVRIRQGVAEDRQISIEDPEMRHGRKTKAKRFNGYKRHLAVDLDSGLVLAAAITPANRPESEAAADLQHDIERFGDKIAELFIDRGYINSPVVDSVLESGGDVICRPWVATNGARYSKSDFLINMRDRTLECPEGVIEHFELGTVVEFPATNCDSCRSRSECTSAKQGRGRTVSIAKNEELQHKLRMQAATAKGRDRLRQRVPVEHRLARLVQRQGKRARYRGCRRNQFDTRRAAAIDNLETIQRRSAA